jgi:putative endonuclease
MENVEGKSKTYVVYVLQSQKDGKFYTGHTGDLERRISEHNRGKVRSTRNRRPLNLLYTEDFESKTEAYARERYLKSLEGGSLKKSLILKRNNTVL